MPSTEGRDSSNESESESDTSSCPDVDEYSGFRPPHGVAYLTNRISADISAEDFFAQYIRPRRPGVIGGLLKDGNWRGHLWTNTYLKKMAGDAQVLVEDRKGLSSGEYLPFGRAPKINMKYGDFVNAVISGETRYYLTTQDLERFVHECDEFGLPKSVSAEPLCHLRDDFPVQPSLLGNLIPHQISLWQGFAGTGQSSSTGLHHDFHDNLYVLIRGRKRFRLFPPSSAPLLQLVGQPTKIHHNGLIVHNMSSRNSRCHGDRDVVSVRADGVPLAVLAQHKRVVAECELTEAEKHLQSLKDCQTTEGQCKEQEILEAENTVAQCEQRLDEALDEQLRYGDDDSSEYDGSSSEVEQDLEPTVKKCKTDIPSEAVVKMPTTCQNELPSHFCNVQLPQSDTVDPQILFKDLTHSDQLGCLVVHLQAGEMLYLPASWFHEVTSCNADNNEATDDVGHLALNYWVYPPNADQFLQPYIDDFWPRRWKQIQQQQKETF
jgi:hypothetical protein